MIEDFDTDIVEAPSSIHALILSPYTLKDLGPMGTARQPLFNDLFEHTKVEHLADATASAGIPAVDLMLLKVELTGAELGTVKSDGRFFVLSPGPGNTGNALTNWLDSKGAAAAGVTQSDDVSQAAGKLTAFLRSQ